MRFQYSMTSMNHGTPPLNDPSPTAPIPSLDGQVVPRFAGLRTFARLPTIAEVESADIAVMGAPFDGGATFRSGARFGPASIREASLLLRPYNEPIDVSPFETVQVCDAGDAPANPVEIGQAHAAIADRAEKLAAGGASVVGLGGDHSITLPLLRVAARAHGPLSLIQFDAHTDTWDSYFGSSVTHGTVFRRAFEEELIDPSSSIQIGLRGSLYESSDYDQNRELGFATVLARELDALGLEDVLQRIRERVTRPTYVTIDVDALDPAFAPGTGTPEPGGLNSRELLALVRGLNDLATPIVAGDVVEVCPAYDPTGVTSLVAANAAFDLVSLLASSHAGRQRLASQPLPSNRTEITHE